MNSIAYPRTPTTCVACQRPIAGFYGSDIATMAATCVECIPDGRIKALLVRGAAIESDKPETLGQRLERKIREQDALK